MTEYCLAGASTFPLHSPIAITNAGVWVYYSIFITKLAAARLT